MEIGDKIPCHVCSGVNKTCGMCNGCGILRMEDCGDGWVLCVPNCLSKEEAIKILKEDLDKLCNRFGLTD